ncbi:hypothetical protein B0H10DRAFT_2214790 [Mycena sp. CBHHK59/15]|nr:hypothetical protein B0H10DRAFT_2214790 [Mycena sp. CBHHK59/15]
MARDMLNSIHDKWNPMRNQPEDYENEHQPEDPDNPEWIEFNPKVTTEGEIGDTFRIFTQPEENPEPTRRAPNTMHIPAPDTEKIRTKNAFAGLPRPRLPGADIVERWEKLSGDRSES